MAASPAASPGRHAACQGASGPPILTVSSLTRETTVTRSTGPMLAVAFALLAGAAPAQNALGVWRTESTPEGFLEVQLAPCAAALCGTILRARTPDGTEGAYAHVGRRMIWDMVADGPGTWSGGRIWDPRRDRVFASRMELRGDRLRVSGCVMGFCQTQEWRRAD